MPSFAIIPAAGTSSRMGRPKLLLPVNGQPLVMHTLAAWRASRVGHVIVVVRPDDQSLIEVLAAAGVEVMIPPSAPPDMKASLAYGLADIERRYQPAGNDSWLVAPADMPGLSPRVIDSLLDESGRSPGRILIPTLAGRRGHPVLLPWSLASELPRLAENEGLNSLIDRHDPLLVSCDAIEAQPDKAFADIDTPDDLARYGI
jgi:molybdenum cofactor cytidylyltransferase